MMVVGGIRQMVFRSIEDVNNKRAFQVFSFRAGARSLFCHFAVSELGTSQSELSRHLGLSAAAVSVAVKRGQKLVQERGYRFP